MRRYWITEDALDADGVSIRGEVLHHIRDVCRLHIGSRFELLLPGGRAVLVEITSESKHESRAKILEERSIPPLRQPLLHLAISLPRLPVLEAVLEKSVELGVFSVHPFCSDYSFFRKVDEAAEVFRKKQDRFTKIIVGASGQSGRGDLMTMARPVALEHALETCKIANPDQPTSGLFAYEAAGEKENHLTLADAIAKIRQSNIPAETPMDMIPVAKGVPNSSGAPMPNLAHLWIFVGSEGGFSEREVEVFSRAGMSAVSLGRQVLRVETACVALISIIKYDFDLMR